jgi:hypothetical protein
MNEIIINEKAREDFNKARLKDRLLKLLHVLTPERHDLLSLNYVKELLKPRGQRYHGMTVVPIKLIVGSEGRYKDFNKAFLPKHEHLRRRWENVDKARIKEVILPPIKLYEIGGVYFVADGNHRVSVAKSQGIQAIDAEVVSLDSEIKLRPNMTNSELKEAVIEYEKKRFFKKTKLNKIIDPDDLNFTDTGRYDEILTHINCHKYFLNESKTYEISFEEAAKSWYDNLFKPIVDEVTEEKLLVRFPGRTKADLYLWIIRHWDDLKKKYGNDVLIEDAARSFSDRFGKGLSVRTKEFLIKVVKRILMILSIFKR